MLRRPGLIVGCAFAGYHYEVFYGNLLFGPVLLLAVLGLTFFLILQDRRFPISKFEALVSVFALVYLTSTYHAKDISEGSLLAGRFVVVCLGYYIIGRFFASNDIFGNFLVFDFGISTSILAVIFGALAITQGLGPARLTLEGASAVGFSQLLDAGAGFCLFIFLSAFHRLTWPSRVILVATLGAIMLIAVLNGTRGTLFSLVLAAAVYLGLQVFSPHAGPGRVRRITVLLFVVLASVIFAAHLFESQFDDVIDRLLRRTSILFASSGAATDPSSASRLMLYREAWELFERAPFLGHGMGSYWRITGHVYPHNVFLELLAESGLVSTVLFAILIGTTGWTGLRLLQITSFSPQSSVAVGIFMIAVAHQQVSGAFWMAKLLFLFMGVIVGLHSRHAKIKGKRPARSHVVAAVK